MYMCFFTAIVHTSYFANDCYGGVFDTPIPGQNLIHETILNSFPKDRHKDLK